MIHIEALGKKFGSFWAVRDLNLHVKQGEVFGFLGPNGAGKTTTMRMLVGLIRPSEGNLSVAGIDVVANPIMARQLIGFIPDRPYLYEKLTAREFMLFTAGIYGLRTSEQEQRAQELIELFGLKDWTHELVESFSHGMKQRLIMAASIIHQPQLLVVDEPMVGLDPRGAVLVKELFRRLVRDRAGTVFLSTHTLEVAEELCDRVAILNRGQIVAIGDMESIRKQAGAEGDENLESLFLMLTGGQDVTESLEKAHL